MRFRVPHYQNADGIRNETGMMEGRPGGGGGVGEMRAKMVDVEVSFKGDLF